MKSFLNFWTSLPGVLTGLAGVLTAIAGLYGAGVFENKNDVKVESTPTVEITPRTIAKTPEIETTLDILEPEPTPTPEIEPISETPKPEPTLTPKPKAEEQKIIETDNFKFQLQSCKRIRTKVVCSMLITNLTNSVRDIYLYMYSDDRATDSSGNIYNFTRLQIGNRNRTSSGSLNTQLSPELPIKANFYLEIPEDIKKLAGLEFSYSSGGKKTLALRNISIVSN